MIRDILRNTTLREALADIIGMLALGVVLLAWLLLGAAMMPAEATAPAAHATVTETLVVVP